jgi:hypothetical protein
MGCTRDNYDYNQNQATNCPSGYNTNHGDCCQYGVYVFWNVALWGGLCLMFTLSIVVAELRRRKVRQERLAIQQNQQQAFIDREFGAAPTYPGLVMT